jgi:hypothetical protein
MARLGIGVVCLILLMAAHAGMLGCGSNVRLSADTRRDSEAGGTGDLAGADEMSEAGAPGRERGEHPFAKHARVSRCCGWLLDALGVGDRGRAMYEFGDVWLSDDSGLAAVTVVRKDDAGGQEPFYRRAVVDVTEQSLLYPAREDLPASNDMHFPFVSACHSRERNVWVLLSGYRSYVLEVVDASDGTLLYSDGNVDELVLRYGDPGSIATDICDSIVSIVE